MDVSHNFHIVDYIVFFGTLAISIGIGLFFACYKGGQTNKQSYFFGDRKFSVVPVSLSILVTYTSAIGTLGYPAEIYQYGPMFIFYPLSQAVGSLIGAFIFVPLLYPLQLTCVNEYYEIRFRGKLARYTASITNLITMELVCALNNFGPAVALQVVTGIPVGVSMAAIGIATVLYTTLGGIKGVIYTDVFQTVVIFIGILALTIQGTLSVGGVGRVFELNRKWDRDEIFDFDPDPTKRMSFWGVACVTTLTFTCMTSTQQNMQRYCALPTLRKAQLSQLLNVPGFVLIGSMLCFCGMVAFAYYAHLGCDPLKAGYIDNPNQILPYFAMDVLRVPGLPGLFIASLVCAAISSQSTSYNSMAAITWDDYLRPLCGRMSATKQTTIIKITVFVYGMLAIALSFVIARMGGSLVQLAYSALASTYGPLFGLTIVAASLPFVNEIAPSIGVICGIIISICLSISASFYGTKAPPLASPIGQCIRSNMSFTNESGWFGGGDNADISPFEFHTYLSGVDRLLAVSYLWYPFIGIMIVAVISLVLSIFPVFRMKERVPENLLFNFMRCLPCPNMANTGYGVTDTEDKEERFDSNDINANSIKYTFKNKNSNRAVMTRV